ncbi:hypothetical protein SYNTR_1418 [Candidatus Syntrophocurvum alkaliphilum]|uniref:YcxB-like C-terminal domain-containing protein n=1 Tax=Candidatus Syntrophocurvum alkaliphilum TaxID=2293317 RepID=A0A6I6DLF9_9FIRM|nr:YcxB family protein [Candidatus Syntrophocurvum alkaliphilum]QGU00012.1 hypothetical protein SYNTR_1418 [Candidatus Syntrophocurvum alkaliphilum]
MTDHRHSEIHIECKGTLTLDDFKSFSFYKRKKFLFTYTLCSFALVFLLYTFLHKIISPEFYSTSIALIISLFGTVIIYIIGITTLSSAAKKEYYSDKVLQNEKKFAIGNKGIKITSEKTSTESFLAWNDFASAHEYKDLFMLNLSLNKAVVIHKRFFYSNEDINTFKTLIKENIPQNNFII